MDINISVVGGGHINDHKSKMRLTLTSDSDKSRQRLMSIAGLLTDRGSIEDAAVIAEWFGITEVEVVLSEKYKE